MLGSVQVGEQVGSVRVLVMRWGCGGAVQLCSAKEGLACSASLVIALTSAK